MHPEEVFGKAKQLLNNCKESEARRMLLQLRHKFPSHVQVIHLLGVAHFRCGDLDKAIAMYREAISLDASRPSYHNNLGNAYKENGELEAALACYQEAIRINPQYAGGYYNLGVLQDALGQTLEGVASLRQCVLHAPDNLDARYVLAERLRDQGEYDGAIHQYSSILKRKPEHFEALINLGGVYASLGYLGKSEQRYREALVIHPDDVLSEYNLGMILRQQQREAEAIKCFERCLALDSEHQGAQVELAMLRINTCDWSHRDCDVANLTRFFQEDVLQLEPSHNRTWSLNQFPSPRELHVRVATQQAESIERATVESRTRCAFTHEKTTPKRLKIGYVSPDFRRHAVGVLAQSMFTHHNREDFEVYGYSLTSVSDQYTHTVRQGCDTFHDVSKLTPEALARQIHADGIHILVDMAGYTTHSKPKTFALRPAPVQVQYLGFLNSMGAPFIDYTIADKLVMDESLRREYTENIVYMPDCFLVSSPIVVPEMTLTRTDCGLPEGGIVFASFNTAYKIDPHIFDAWMSILNQVPNSVLWLSAASDKSVGERLDRQAQARGVDPARIIAAEQKPMEIHLSRCRQADLFLDTSLYNGGATTVTALQAELPVLTHYGTTVHSRMGASIVAAAGLPELATHNLEEYVDFAVSLAQNPQALQALKDRLHTQGLDSPLLDTAQFVSHLESGYHAMWGDYLDGATRDIVLP